MFCYEELMEIFSSLIIDVKNKLIKLNKKVRVLSNIKIKKKTLTYVNFFLVDYCL